MASRGRHRRPRRAVPAVAGTLTGAVTAGALITGTAHAAPAQHVTHVTAFTGHHRAAAARRAEQRVVVVPGNTLSGISQDHCGTPADWTGIYDANKSVIGGNPGLIIPGQHLALDCVQGEWAPARSQDNDPAPARHVTAYYSGSGTLSFSGLESLWESAGGPSWAAWQAATVAECESGGRENAYNPSGASGPWQILGEVVPGNVFNPMVNAENAVAKFRASGDTWDQWVCKP